MLSFLCSSAVRRRGTAAPGKSDSGAGTSATGRTRPSPAAATTPSGTPFRRPRTKARVARPASASREPTEKLRCELGPSL